MRCVYSAWEMRRVLVTCDKVIESTLSNITPTSSPTSALNCV